MRPFAASPATRDHCGSRRQAIDQCRASDFVGYSGVLTQPRPNADMSISNCSLPLQASQLAFNLSFADAAKSRNRS